MGLNYAQERRTQVRRDRYFSATRSSFTRSSRIRSKAEEVRPVSLIHFILLMMYDVLETRFWDA